MIGIPLALAYTNAGEWLIHKYILHGLGKDKRSFWSFHWHDHHQNARKLDMHDPQYTRSLLGWGPETKEVVALLGAAVVHLPLLPIAPFFAGTVLYRTYRYYKIHKKAHLDSNWAKQNVPWHVDHHMGRNQNLNWCVTHPFFDWVMGTRKEYSKEEWAQGAGKKPAAVRVAVQIDEIDEREEQRQTA